MSRIPGADTSPHEHEKFIALLRELAVAGNDHFAFAALNDLLHACPAAAFDDLVRHAAATAPPLSELSPLRQNYVAAMVEQAAEQKGVQPPAWVRDIPGLAEPYFAGGLKSLEPYLLAVSPGPYRRRNLFVDTGVGGRV